VAGFDASGLEDGAVVASGFGGEFCAPARNAMNIDASTHDSSTINAQRDGSPRRCGNSSFLMALMEASPSPGL
jgi:hypothetical protein